MARPRAFDREHAIATAMLIFWREGFPVASVERLCHAMGVGSSSFYAAFGSKEKLFREAVACYLNTVGRRYWAGLAEGDNAREGIGSVLLAGATLLPATERTPGGCMICLGAVSEAWPSTAAEPIRRGRLHWTTLIRERLETARICGELPDQIDVGNWSRFYMAAFQGMAAQARDGATSDDLLGIAASAMAAWPTFE